MMKRKRGTGARNLIHAGKKQKIDQPNYQTPVTDNRSRIEVNAAKDTIVDVCQVREAIESQFSLEILLRHNELRLINQELAKCQVALEQLRRCHLVPYPSTQGTTESMFHISNGTGPAVGPKKEVPLWASPHGVSDGPYSRHYAKWLIQDSKFDGAQVEWNGGLLPSGVGKTPWAGHAGFVGRTTPTRKTRSQSRSLEQGYSCHPLGYPLESRKIGHCVLKRDDSQDFSSPQGFVNHCRIAHHREFKSNQEAAFASGQLVDVDGKSGIFCEERSPVHPPITIAPTDKESSYKAILSCIEETVAMLRLGKLSDAASIPTSSKSPNQTFVPSPDAPHLSAFLRRKGFHGDFAAIVVEARKKFDSEELWPPHQKDSEDGARCRP